MKKCIIAILTGITILGMTACGSNISGKYVSEYGNGTLIIESDKWEYSYENRLYGTQKGGGYIEKKDNDTYALLGADPILYADIDKDHNLYVYSDSSRWVPETFRRVGK